MSKTLFSPRTYPRLNNFYQYRSLTINSSPVHLFKTAETRALVIGGLKYENRKLSFRLGRLHFNGLRNLDLDIATHLLMLSTEFKQSIEEFQHRGETVGAMLLREPIAQNPFLNASLANINSTLYMILDAHHVEDKNGIKGKSSELSYYRLDIPKDVAAANKIKKQVKHVILTDSIAAGRNLITAIAELKKLFPNLQKLTIISTFATKQGIKRIIQNCKNTFQLKSEFFVFHELLSVNPVNEYDCFFPEDHHDLRDQKLLQLVYGENYNRICLGGDFTANIYGKYQAKAVWQEQIKALGLTKKQPPLTEISIKQLRELGYSFDDIVPYSSIYVAAEKGHSLEELIAAYHQT